MKTFAGLTNKDGSFLVARKKDDNFNINKLVGKHVVAGRAGGMPVMNFEWALRNSNIDPKEDLNVHENREYLYNECIKQMKDISNSYKQYDYIKYIYKENKDEQ